MKRLDTGQYFRALTSYFGNELLFISSSLEIAAHGLGYELPLVELTLEPTTGERGQRMSYSLAFTFLRPGLDYVQHAHMQT